MRYPIRGGFVGYNGVSFPLKNYPDDHPVVAAFPDLFTDKPPPGVKPEKPKRRVLKKSAAKKATAAPATASATADDTSGD
jgi:hypothetical protein